MSERHRDCDLVVVSRRCLSQSTTEERGDQATNATADVRRVRESCALRVPPVPSVLHTGGRPSSPPLLPLYCYRFSASPSRSKRLEVRRREGGRQQGGREGGQATDLRPAGWSLSPPPLPPVTKRAEPPSVSPPQCLPKPKNGRRLRSWGRGEERRAANREREESIVTWLSRLSPSLPRSLAIPFHPSVQAAIERGTRVRLALDCKVFAIAGSEKRSAWTSAKFLELPLLC